MAKFSQQCSKNGALAQLRSITLTVHQQTPLDTWMHSVLDLLSPSPLEVFQIYSTGAFFESPSTTRFWSQLVSAHGARLKRFSVHRMLISLDAIDDICTRCTALEQLFLVLEPASLVNTPTPRIYIYITALTPGLFPAYGRSVSGPISHFAVSTYKLPAGGTDGCGSCPRCE